MKQLLFLCMLCFSGCLSSYKTLNNPSAVSPSEIEITFENLDLNQDGNVSEIEVANFNELSNSNKSGAYQVYGPAWVMLGIVVATVSMCAMSALIKCNKSE